jgi:hypothetical protein
MLSAIMFHDIIFRVIMLIAIVLHDNIFRVIILSVEFSL